MITGQLISTPLEALRLESSVQSYYSESKRKIVQAREKCLHTAADHPKQVALQNDIPQRIATRFSFRRKATELSTILPEELSHCQVAKLFSSHPWLPSLFCTNQVSSTIPGISGRDDPPVTHTVISSQLHHVYRRFSKCRHKEWWAAAIVSMGSPTQLTVVSSIKIKSRAFTSSYEEEIVAIETALQWAFTSANSVQSSILICKDSQSLCEALSSCNPQTTSIRQRISSISSSIEPDTIHPTPLSCVFQVINELFCDGLPSHARRSKIYQHHKTSTDLQLIKCHRDDVLIAQLRSRHHLSLKAHHRRIEPAIDPTCL